MTNANRQTAMVTAAHRAWLLGAARAARTNMASDSKASPARRGAVGAVIASVGGRTEVYVSGGAEHQGPPGGSPFAVIVTA